MTFYYSRCYQRRRTRSAEQISIRNSLAKQDFILNILTRCNSVIYIEVLCTKRQKKKQIKLFNLISVFTKIKKKDTWGCCYGFIIWQRGNSIKISEAPMTDQLLAVFDYGNIWPVGLMCCPLRSAIHTALNNSIRNSVLNQCCFIIYTCT